MYKIYVERNVGKALDWLIAGCELTDARKSDIISMRVKHGFSHAPHSENLNPLNVIDVILLARILDNGYYYDLTPYEEVARTYRDKRDTQNTTRDHKTLFDAEAFANGMRFVITTLGLNVEGVEKE
ncbi:hypothetical protein M3_0151 [Lysinibacillus phage vB_LfM_LysYB1]|nr:hypothetical protein M3_0151 [Lysinibacillus phage vB_LfM_LysYB1]WAB25338.1 hypothetical protein M5_0160 [Lysinibacillus phage vB_LfM_LysYB2]